MGNSRISVILAADLPDYQRIESRDKERADELASRFHQVFGECVYACEGTVVDTMGSIVIAELSDPAQAVQSLESLRKRAQTEFASEAALRPRAVLIRGEVRDKDFSVAGRAVQNALAILDSLGKEQMLVAADLVKESGHVASGDPVLELGGMGFFAMPLARLAPAAPAPASAAQAPPASPGKAPSPAATPAATPAAAGEVTEATPTPKSRTGLMIGAAIVVVLLLGGLGFWLMGRSEPEPAVAEAPPPAPEPTEPAETVIELSVGEIAIAEEVEIEGEPALEAPILIEALLQPADNVKLGGVASNRVGVDVRMIAPEPQAIDTDGTNPPITAAAQLAPDAVEEPATEPEPRVIPWVERSGERLEGPESPYEDIWSIVVPAVSWAGEQLGFRAAPLIPQSEELREAFRSAVLGGSTPEDEVMASLHQALMSEPEFLAGWLVLSRAETDDPELEPAIMDALRNISRLMPERTDLARDLGRQELVKGTLAGAIDAFGRVRSRHPDDEEARRVLGLAALAAHQPQLFQRHAESTDDPRFHTADVAVSEGDINEAVKKYYETEAQVSDNPYLSFKIGRIAVLRRSPQIAQIEMDKLESAGREPQRSFLRAYMAADEGNRSGAELALQEALKNAEWSDSPWFHAAEIYAILRDAQMTMDAIEKSVDRQEPMMHAITTNSLFRYLAGEPRFRESVRELLQHQRTIAARLQQLS